MRRTATTLLVLLVTTLALIAGLIAFSAPAAQADHNNDNLGYFGTTCYVREFVFRRPGPDFYWWEATCRHHGHRATNRHPLDRHYLVRVGGDHGDGEVDPNGERIPRRRNGSTDWREIKSRQVVAERHCHRHHGVVCHRPGHRVR